MTIHEDRAEPWTVTLVDTGDNSMTGGRLKRVLPYIKMKKHFVLLMEMVLPILILKV